MVSLGYVWWGWEPRQLFRLIYLRARHVRKENLQRTHVKTCHSRINNEQPQISYSTQIFHTFFPSKRHSECSSVTLDFSIYGSFTILGVNRNYFKISENGSDDSVLKWRDVSLHHQVEEFGRSGYFGETLTQIQSHYWSRSYDATWSCGSSVGD